MSGPLDERQILGVNFYVGDVQGAIGRISQGGLLVVNRHLDYLPAIHCIGAAIAFLSGDQVRIPSWADKLYLGWLCRCLSSPRRFIPRYPSAPQPIPLIWRYGD
jgi:hypothetical protein